MYIDELLKNAEKYEGTLVHINALEKKAGEWPSSNSSKDFLVTDGYKDLKLRLDDDTDLGNNPEPVYPMNLVGVVSQYYLIEPAFGGYQLLLTKYADIEQNVEVAPSPYFYFTQDTKDNENGSYGVHYPISFTASLDWHPAIDLNNDNLIYEVAVIRQSDGVEVAQELSDSEGKSARSSKTNKEIIDFVQAWGQYSDNDTAYAFTGSWVIRVTDGKTGMIASVDTLKNFTLLDYYTEPTDVDEENTLPTELSLDQNYPNPFNPSTTITYSIPQKSKVTLKVYDVLGSELKTLINKENPQGNYG